MRITTILLTAGPLDEKNIEKYDSLGYTSENINLNGKDSLKSQSSFEHNSAGFMTSMKTTGAKNELKSSMTIEYDGMGKYSLAKSHDSTGKLDVYYADITSQKS
jgi:hypothetical protein